MCMNIVILKYYCIFYTFICFLKKSNFVGLCPWFEVAVAARNVSHRSEYIGCGLGETQIF